MLVTIKKNIDKNLIIHYLLILRGIINLDYFLFGYLHSVWLQKLAVYSSLQELNTQKKIVIAIRKMLYLTSRRLRRAVSLASLHKPFSVDVMVPTLGGSSECVAQMWFEIGKKAFCTTALHA